MVFGVLHLGASVRHRRVLLICKHKVAGAGEDAGPWQTAQASDTFAPCQQLAAGRKCCLALLAPPAAAACAAPIVPYPADAGCLALPFLGRPGRCPFHCPNLHAVPQVHWMQVLMSLMPLAGCDTKATQGIQDPKSCVAARGTGCPMGALGVSLVRSSVYEKWDPKRCVATNHNPGELLGLRGVSAFDWRARRHQEANVLDGKIYQDSVTLEGVHLNCEFGKAVCEPAGVLWVAGRTCMHECLRLGFCPHNSAAVHLMAAVSMQLDEEFKEALVGTLFAWVGVLEKKVGT
eukprot:1161127-Pelagomonas_calceolata.AAC.12